MRNELRDRTGLGNGLRETPLKSASRIVSR
jgi:hypothetical protein